jgi:hypothetical protein
MTKSRRKRRRRSRTTSNWRWPTKGQRAPTSRSVGADAAVGAGVAATRRGPQPPPRP